MDALMMKKPMWAAVLVICVSRAWGVVPTADEKPLRHALQGYLSKQGSVCLGKFDWPIDVTESDFKDRTRDAVQMPVLEKLGLVTSSDITANRPTEADPGAEAVTVKRFELTGAGKKYYVPKEAITRGAGYSQVEHHRDLCVAHLSVDKVVRWDESPAQDGLRQGTILYTYHATVADWARSPSALQVFPMIDRLIKGEGTLQLEQRMRLDKGGWSAVIGLD